MARLIWRQKDGHSRLMPLGDEAILGRDGSLACVLNVKSVSRRHARIERREGDYFILDLESTNGTLVNGSRIQEATPLKNGDLIQVGEELLEFDCESISEHLTKGSLVTEPLSRAEGAAAAGEAFSPESGAFPQRTGKFYLLKKLGQGGMGAVFHAIDLDSNREVAVKFIRSHIGRREAFLDFFHNREAVLAREINHPNVIRVYEHGVDADQHYISMEYVRSWNLFQVMKQRRLKPDEVLEILRQVACGLAAAHRQGVVHSDIKPANILLVEDGDKAPAAGEAMAAEDGTRKDADSARSILEFEGESAADNERAQGQRAYDAGLFEEIHRRIGEPSREVLVDPPYFPRLSESRFLEHYLDRMLEGKGYFLLVEGEAGMGKDRLISEFLNAWRAAVEASQKDGRVGGDGGGGGGGGGGGAATGSGELRFHELDCSRIEGIPHLYEQLLHVRLSGTQGLRRMVEELSQSLTEDPRPAVVRILNLGSASALVCDMIGRWARFMPQKRLLLIGALDPEDIRKNDSLKPLLERLAPYTKELYLRPLTEYQIQKYLQQIFRDAMMGIDLAADLYRLSGGNFAKLLDILRSFFDRGVLTLDLPSGRLLYRPRAQEFELEEGKNLYAKYRSYGKAEQRVLEQAAFVGPRFLFDTLLKFHNINETSLYFIVRTLLAEGFFVEESRTWYGFTNVAFQHYMADRIPAAERPHLHRKLSRFLQTVPVPESADLFQLRARHLEGCNEYAKAVQCLLEGAHLARNEYRLDLSRELYQEILRVYRQLAARETLRKEVTAVLRDWFRRDGNWYEILGELGSEAPVAKVKIADFGISFRIADDKRGYQVEKRPVLGTPRYLAPERVKGEHGGPQSDIFSLGIIAYEMASGEPPFPELRGDEVMEANRKQHIALTPDVLVHYPPGMDRLLAGILEKDSRRRWDAERVLREVVKIQFDAQIGERR